MQYDALDSVMKSKEMTFMEAMRCLCMDTFFKQVARARSQNRELIVLEDGGYTTPILNDAALKNMSVKDVRAEYSCPTDEETDRQLGDSLLMSDVLKNNRVVGTIEYTRNGYDHDLNTQLKNNNELFVPNMTVAVSYKKTQIEADGVAESCLNAITSAMYSHGMVLKHRNALVIGSRGNIGRWFIRSLHARLDRRGLDRDESILPAVIGCDLKVGRTPPSVEIPNWQKRDDEPALQDIKEQAKWGDFEKEQVRELDLVIGITGGPTSGHQTMDRDNLIDWLANGTKETIFIASGSTKTDEFPDLLEWTNEVLKQPSVDLLGRSASITKDDLTDALTKRSYGARYQFVLDKTQNTGKTTKDVIFLNNLMPINFLFYAVPTEIIDETLAQLLSVTACLHRQAPKLDKARVYAIDYDRVASENVYGAKMPDHDIPLPPPGA